MAHLPHSSRALLVTALALVAPFSCAIADNWENTLTPFPPDTFPELRSARAQYKFGWNGISAASAELHVTHPGDGRVRLETTGGTTGFTRALWKYDLKSSSIADAGTLRPITERELETTRKKTTETQVTFTPERVTSREEKRSSEVKIKLRDFDFPNVLSANSAVLFVRALPLLDGAVERVVVYPASAAYLCTVTVLGREHLKLPAGGRDAIKLDVKLNKIGKSKELLPFKKCKRATLWLSNDSDRLVLRIEAQVFVGTVFAELQSVQFESGQP